MNKKIKIIISIFIISFVIFSAIEYSEIPSYKENLLSKSNVKKCMEEEELTGIKCFTASYGSSNSSFIIAVDTVYGMWEAADVYGFSICMAKTSQNLGFLFTNSMFIVNNIIIKNENNTVIAHLNHKWANTFDNTTSFNYLMSPYYTYKAPFNISLTIHGEYVLYSLIYHIQIYKTLTYIVKIP